MIALVRFHFRRHHEPAHHPVSHRFQWGNQLATSTTFVVWGRDRAHRPLHLRLERLTRRRRRSGRSARHWRVAAHCQGWKTTARRDHALLHVWESPVARRPAARSGLSWACRRGLRVRLGLRHARRCSSSAGSSPLPRSVAALRHRAKIPLPPRIKRLNVGCGALTRGAASAAGADPTPCGHLRLPPEIEPRVAGQRTCG